MSEHHARLYIGESLNVINDEVPLVTDADTQISLFDSFSIGDARMLIAAAQLAPVTKPTREFYLFMHHATTEAQNALLKLLEEPPHTAVFYVVVPHQDVLIDTVRSRLQLVSTQSDERVDMSFVEASHTERLNMVAEAAKQKDVVWFEQSLRSAEVFAEKSKDSQLMQDVCYVRTVYAAPGASKKMLFEHLALSLD